MSSRPVATHQLEFDLGPAGPRWRFSRPVTRSPHFARICDRLERARRHFPELDGVCVRVGLARKRGVLGWGSLDPDLPAIWVRPRRLDYFTIAHELTHLLQARRLVPRGERACDLHALARSPWLVDAAPSYLELPDGIRDRPLPQRLGHFLHRAAVRSLEARAQGDRRYLRRFEDEVREALRKEPTMRRVRA